MGERWLASPREAAAHIDAMASRLPEGDPRKAEIRSLLATLADECGCEMGGIFFTTATIAAVAYFVMAGPPSAASGLLGIGFVFGASVLGKLVGLTVARVRLGRLRGVIGARLSLVEAGHVDVH
jgi:hypothetical protein